MPGFIAANRGKKSVCLDVHTALGRQVVARLLEKADVLLTNYREPFLRSIGLDYETLSKTHPQLIWARVNGFGPKGPDAGKPMLDGAAQARGGLLNMSGLPGGPPTGPGAAIADLAGAMQLALAVMTAIVARERHGVGQKVETSSLGAQLWLQQWEIQQCIVTGQPLQRKGSYLPNIEGAYGVYSTQDGGAFMLASIQDEEAWDALCIFAEMFELIGDEQWNSQTKRMSASGTGDASGLREVLIRGFASKTTSEWVDFMYSQPTIIMERVRNHADVVSDEQNITNEYIVPMDMPVIGESKVVGNLIQMSATPGSVKGPAPQLGQHTAEVMESLGYGADEVSKVQADAQAALATMLAALGLEPAVGTEVPGDDDA